MKKTIVMCLVAMIIAIGGVTMAADEPKIQTTEKPKTEATEKLTASLKQFEAEVQKILTRENVHSMLDRPRLLKEYGVTYQPELVVPDDLASKLSSCNLRIYAGIKMYDAVYAAVFNKGQEVAKSIQAIEEVMQKLDLRSHADFSGHMLGTVRKAASETENINIKEMLDQLTTDSLNELPVFMSSSESSHYLMDAIYGFTVEAIYVMGYFHQADQNDSLMKLRMQQPTFMAWINAVDRVLAAFEKAKKDLHIECQSPISLDIMKDVTKLAEAERSGKITTKEGRIQLAVIRERLAKIRASVLVNAK